MALIASATAKWDESLSASSTYRIDLRGDSLRRRDPAADGADGASPPTEAAMRDYPQHIGKEESIRG